MDPHFHQNKNQSPKLAYKALSNVGPFPLGPHLLLLSPCVLLSTPTRLHALPLKL